MRELIKPWLIRSRLYFLKVIPHGKQDDVGALSPLTIEKIAYLICRGGWPASIGIEGLPTCRMAMDYVEAIIRQEVSRVDNVEKNPERVRLLLGSLAKNISTTLTFQTIRKDLEATDIGISDKTIQTYMNALRRIFVIEDLPAWAPSLRSKTAIRTSEKGILWILLSQQPS